ncbi:lipopolysaccharide export system protein LptC [Saccharopolyspora lacisalsi]|uniref:Lipopolysaccharide export system protein LptC n=1 Tax=Halosaccharopolyspora lacisalsi TaxID=1000566 RepID=A0A839DX27_9PSEU|nr:hypothetical protein [Halosaccharopolyspora lacisalsi]MBA8825430.1 lipopolysaccharide export system protein LptC [Halosaccharopolyspora lacisalsi]
MSSRRRITIALVGLIVLVIVGWLVRQNTGGDSGAESAAASVATARHETGRNFSSSLIL